ncbi:MAG TPA: two-component system response regulator [Acidimicrobiaceae bacterium]|nr:two-component system response regulator [Acidimicrobiaceae bacterium]
MMTERTPEVVARILVVDDDAAVRESTADILEAAGYAVSQATDVEDALAHLAAGRVSLLILDLGLSGRRGREPSRVGLDLLDRVAQLPPVILVSGSNVAPTPDPRVRAFFPKPVAPSRLLDEVGQLLGT